MNRPKLFILWLLCLIVTPILIFMMLLELIAGSLDRAQRMANAFDACGNALLGGSEKMTISERTGNGLIQKLPWAERVAPIIDYFFGKGHCISKATLIKTKGD